MQMEGIGVGEIIVNSIDHDGKMDGFDLSLIDLVRDLTDCPITVLGGAGKLEDIEKIISKYKIIGVSAGSLFVFKEPRLLSFDQLKSCLKTVPDECQSQISPATNTPHKI